MKSIARLLLALTVFVATAQAADPPYVGKWKFNAAKSTLTGDTATIENTPDGMMQFNSQGFIYKFKPDGKDSASIVQRIDKDQIGIRYGDFHSRRLIEHLGLAENGGVIRVSMVHYNTVEEVDRLVASLDRALS